MKYIYIIIALCFTLQVEAQKKGAGEVTTKNGVTLAGEIRLINSEQALKIKENSASEPQTYSYSNIKSVSIEDTKYVTITYDNKLILAEELVDGKATLLDIGNDRLLVRKSGEESQVLYMDSTNPEKNKIPGILSLIFNDCNSIREDLKNGLRYTQYSVVETVKAYNNCDYNNTGYIPTEQEISMSSDYQRDEFLFYGGIGATLNRSSFFNFDDYESFTQPQIQIGVLATPGFVGSLQGKLFFYLEALASFSGDRDYENAGVPASLKKSSLKAIIGPEYHFNTDKTIQPVIGVGFGVGADTYKGKYDGFAVDDTGGHIFLAPKIGLLFNLSNGKKIGVMANYITEYEAKLNYERNNTIAPIIIDTHNFTLGINYYF
ncbi:outer membrane beta-barrel protein [Jejudonia soesokkakensis]|uniref:Outer membrane beta-barrel protein n=1 Tax=Jejudonia soesokkakensis TaxID=1323432 RepID=A0ABW2MNX2_9FLAO